MMTGLKFLDLFAGAGGLSEGFIQAGFSPVAHIEMDSAACYTLKTRMAYHWLVKQNKSKIYIDYLNGQLTRSEFYNLIPSHILDSIICTEINDASLPNLFTKVNSALSGHPLDLIIGGPPCQAYSLVGRARDKQKMQGDHRNYLYKHYAQFLKRFSPRWFVFENVLGLLSAKDESETLYLDAMRKTFLSCGYQTDIIVASAEKHGVPQKRKRIILVGRKGKTPINFSIPEATPPKTTVYKILNDLPRLRAGEGSFQPCRLRKCSEKWLYTAGIRDDNIPVTGHIARPHNKRDLKIYQLAVQAWKQNKTRVNYNSLPKQLKTHKNCSAFTDRFKVVAGNLSASHTIVAHIAKDGHYYIHPDIKQNRSLTPREAARLQTFPDNV